jgi:hypothetical protein
MSDNHLLVKTFEGDATFSGRLLSVDTIDCLDIKSPPFTTKHLIGYIKPKAAESTIFYVSSIGAIRIVVDGNVILDSWKRAPTVPSGPTAPDNSMTFYNCIHAFPSTNFVPISVEISGAHTRIEWSSLSFPRCFVKKKDLAYSPSEMSPVWHNVLHVISDSVLNDVKAATVKIADRITVGDTIAVNRDSIQIKSVTMSVESDGTLNVLGKKLSLAGISLEDSGRISKDTLELCGKHTVKLSVGDRDSLVSSSESVVLNSLLRVNSSGEIRDGLMVGGDLSVNGKMNPRTLVIGLGKWDTSMLTLTGSNNSLRHGPHITTHVETDPLPVLCFSSLAHDNASINFDCDIEGKKSHQTCVRLQKHANRFDLMHDSDSVSLSVDLVSGDVSVASRLSVAGDIDVNSITMPSGWMMHVAEGLNITCGSTPVMTVDGEICDIVSNITNFSGGVHVKGDITCGGDLTISGKMDINVVSAETLMSRSAHTTDLVVEKDIVVSRLVSGSVVVLDGSLILQKQTLPITSDVTIGVKMEHLCFNAGSVTDRHGFSFTAGPESVSVLSLLATGGLTINGKNSFVKFNGLGPEGMVLTSDKNVVVNMKNDKCVWTLEANETFNVKCRTVGASDPILTLSSHTPASFSRSVSVSGDVTSTGVVRSESMKIGPLNLTKDGDIISNDRLTVFSTASLTMSSKVGVNVNCDSESDTCIGKNNSGKILFYQNDTLRFELNSACLLLPGVKTFGQAATFFDASIANLKTKNVTGIESMNVESDFSLRNENGGLNLSRASVSLKSNDVGIEVTDDKIHLTGNVHTGDLACQRVNASRVCISADGIHASWMTLKSGWLYIGRLNTTSGASTECGTLHLEIISGGLHLTVTLRVTGKLGVDVVKSSESEFKDSIRTVVYTDGDQNHHVFVQKITVDPAALVNVKCFTGIPGCHFEGCGLVPNGIHSGFRDTWVTCTDADTDTVTEMNSVHCNVLHVNGCISTPSIDAQNIGPLSFESKKIVVTSDIIPRSDGLNFGTVENRIGQLACGNLDSKTVSCENVTSKTTSIEHFVANAAKIKTTLVTSKLFCENAFFDSVSSPKINVTQISSHLPLCVDATSMFVGRVKMMSDGHISGVNRIQTIAFGEGSTEISGNVRTSVLTTSELTTDTFTTLRLKGESASFDTLTLTNLNVKCSDMWKENACILVSEPFVHICVPGEYNGTNVKPDPTPRMSVCSNGNIYFNGPLHCDDMSHLNIVCGKICQFEKIVLGETVEFEVGLDGLNINSDGGSMLNLNQGVLSVTSGMMTDLCLATSCRVDDVLVTSSQISLSDTVTMRRDGSSFEIKNENGELRFTSSGGNGFTVAPTSGNVNFTNQCTVNSQLSFDTVRGQHSDAAALNVMGGAMVHKSLFVGNDLVIGEVTLRSERESERMTLTLPRSLPKTRQFLTADSDGTLMWSELPTPQTPPPATPMPIPQSTPQTTPPATPMPIPQTTTPAMTPTTQSPLETKFQEIIIDLQNKIIELQQNSILGTVKIGSNGTRSVTKNIIFDDGVTLDPPYHIQGSVSTMSDMDDSFSCTFKALKRNGCKVTLTKTNGTKWSDLSVCVNYTVVKNSGHC